MFMKRNATVALLAVALLAVLMPSCTNNYFNEERYEDLVKSTFPVSDIDSLHDWNLLKTVNAVFDLSASPAGKYVVDLYDGNPSDSSTKKLATGVVSGYGSFKFNLGKDDDRTRLYAVAYDGENCVLNGFSPFTGSTLFVQSEPSAGFSRPDAIVAKDVEYTYCFEETFPEGGDFDFNDVVMGVTISKIPKAGSLGGHVVELTIRLRAVGGFRPLAASLRIADVTPEMLAPTFSMPRKGWDFFVYADYFIDDPKGEIRKCKNGDARIDLFNDAHYALNGGKLDKSGTQVPRYYINTQLEMEEPEWESADVKTSTYRIEFLDEEAFNEFNFTDIDLFLISSYNASFYEIHTPPYFGLRAVKDYPTNIYYIPWALVVPELIQYPLEGIPMGKFSSDLNYYEGAYQQTQYSFGAWARNRNNVAAWGWYHYPNDKSVYPLN